MVKRISGLLRKSRYKLRKSPRTRGKISLSKYMQEFKDGQKVHLQIEPAVQKGQYYLKYLGLTGVVKGQQGSCYKVAINNFGKQKVLLIHPVHLQKVQ